MRVLHCGAVLWRVVYGDKHMYDDTIDDDDKRLTDDEERR